MSGQYDPIYSVRRLSQVDANEAGESKKVRKDSILYMHPIGKDTYWVARSAEQGYPDAQYDLGNIYEAGWGVPKDHEKAVHWWTKAAEQGLVNAQMSLAYMHCERGKVSPQDFEKAVFWFRKAAEKGYFIAQHCLGEMYYSGEGVTQDYRKSYVWYSLATAQSRQEDYVKARDAAAAKLSPEDLKKAQAAAIEMRKRIQAKRKQKLIPLH